MNQTIKGFGKLPTIEITEQQISYGKKEGMTTILLNDIEEFEVTTGTMSEFGYVTMKTKDGEEKKFEFGAGFNKTMQKLQSELGKQNVTQPTTVKEPKQPKPRKSIAELEAEMPDSWKEKQAEKARVEQMKKDKIPFCPKCHSTSLTYQDKKLSIGRAMVGGAIAGGAGAILGGTTSKKGNLKCLNCGHTWKI